MANPRLLCARHENYQLVFDSLNYCSQEEGFTVQILIGSRTNKFHKKCIWSAFYQSNDQNNIVTDEKVAKVANLSPMCATAVVKGQALSCSNGLNGISIIWQHNSCECSSSQDFRLGETPSNKGLRIKLISNVDDICAWMSEFETQSFQGSMVQFDSNFSEHMLLSAALLLASLPNDTCDDTTRYYVFVRIFNCNKIVVMGVNKKALGDRKGHLEIFQEQVGSLCKNVHEISCVDMKLEVVNNS